MDLSDLSNLLPFPWSLIAGIVIPIVLGYLGVKLPNLKPKPNDPAPKPSDPPAPAPSIPDRPILNALLALLALVKTKSFADLETDEKALVAAMFNELDPDDDEDDGIDDDEDDAK